jgi:hypothetical protein
MKSTLIAALMICSIPAALAQGHSPAQAPMDATLITENEFVQVLRISIPPHGKTPMHEVTPRVVVWLTDAHFADHYADGTVREETRKAGDAEWVSARRHAGENLADKPMEFIAVVMKQAAARRR